MEGEGFAIKRGYMWTLLNCTCRRYFKAHTCPSPLKTCTKTTKVLEVNKNNKQNNKIKGTRWNITNIWHTIPLCPLDKRHQDYRFFWLCTDIQIDWCTLSLKYHQTRFLKYTHLTLKFHCMGDKVRKNLEKNVHMWTTTPTRRTEAAIHFVILTHGTCVLMCACVRARGAALLINHVEWALFSCKDKVQFKYTGRDGTLCEIFTGILRV